MKSNRPGILDKAFPGFFDSDDSNDAKSKPTDLGEDFFFQLAQNARDIILHARLVPKFRFDYVSPSVFAITGYTPEEFYKDHLLAKKITHPDDAHLVGDPYEPGFRPPAGPQVLRWIRKDGAVIWTEHLITFTQDEKGRYTACQIIARDITGRKEADDALMESQIFTESLMQNAPHATIVLNPDSSVKYVNPAWEKLNGWTLAEVIDLKAPYPWWPEEYHNEDFIIAFNESIQQGSGKAEIVAIKKNGEPYWIDINWTQVTNNGKAEYILINSVDITERKQAEKALQESEEKFSRAFNASPDIISIISVKDDRFIEVNESFTRFTGYTREEVIGRKISELNSWVNPEDREKMLEIFKKQGRVYNEEFLFMTKSGDVRSLLFSMDMIKIGDEPCYISVSNDITERKRVEAALRESEEKFSKIFTSSPNAICIMGIDNSQFIEVNPSFEQFTGYSRDEIIGSDPLKLGLCNEEEQDKIGRALDETGHVFNFRINSRAKSGETINGLLSAQTIDIHDDKRLIIVITDITDQVKAEEAIANEATFRRILIEQSRDGIVILDQNGAVYEANRRFAEMIGYTPEEVTRLHVWDWEYQYPRERVVEMIRTVDEAGDHFETKHRRKDGSIYNVEISTNGAIFAGQKLIFCVCRDITERVQMEKALRESEEKFSKAFHASPEIIAITTLKEGKFIDFNDTYTANTGYTREELLGRTSKEIDAWADKAERENMIRTLKEEGRVRNKEYRFRTKSGEIRTWLFSAEPINIAGEPCLMGTSMDITERKRMEEALKSSEEKFSKAFNSSPVSLSISRLSDGKLLEVNESFLRNKGYSREEVIGRTARQLGIWAYAEEQNRIINLVKTQGRALNQELHYRTKSGEIRTGLVSAELIKIGDEPCMLVLNNDITGQKKASEQLRMLGMVTRQVSDATIIFDMDFNITYMNRAAENLFGYSFEEVKGRNLSFFNKVPASEEKRRQVTKTLMEGKVNNEIIVKQRKDGTAIICDCRLSPMYDEKGNICSFIDVQRDITRQKEVETKLQEHKKLIDSILATMPEGVLVIDNQDRIILANKAIYKILHLNVKAVKSRTLSEVLPLDQYFNIHRAVTSRNNENNTVEFRYNVQGAEKIIYCVIVKMDGGRTLITFSDVSREREEEEKLYLTDRLASIGEMAAGLAHELNNPLTGILTLSQVLVGSDLPPEHKEDIECIYSEARRAAGIVKNVLLFARNRTDETGKAGVNEVIKDVLRLREYEERSNNIKVKMDLEEDLPDIAIDKGQLQQVFLNMISNAEAAIKEAGRPGVLNVISERVGNNINIHFSDNGCGIKKQFLPRIFDPFFTTKQVGKGTGLGLSICYSIIVKHGGKISVKSQVNEGTTFTIRMPVANHAN